MFLLKVTAPCQQAMSDSTEFFVDFVSHQIVKFRFFFILYSATQQRTLQYVMSAKKMTSQNQMQKQVESSKAPDSIDRVDIGNPEQGDRLPHIHFKNGRHALYNDGTWKHEGRILSREEKQWLSDNGWPLPK